MGHSLGNLKDRYIFQTEGADQLCGRILSGLPFHNELFGTLCPHFTDEIQNMLTDTFWQNVVPEYQYYPNSFKSCMSMLLASIIFHEKFLRDNLPSSFFDIRVFASNEYLQILRENVRTGLNYCSSTKLKATGVPSHLLMVIKMHQMEETLQTLRESMLSEMELESKRREHFMTEFPIICSREVGEYLKQNFEINGVIPITRSDIDNMHNDFMERITAEIQTVFNSGVMQLTQSRLVDSSTAANHDGSQLPYPTQTSVSKYKVFKWNDHDSVEYYVPIDWCFPNRQCSTKMLWDLWFFGNVDIGVRPYRLLRRQYDIRKGPPQNRYSHASVVITVLKNIMLEQNMVESDFDFANIDLVTSDTKFQMGYNYLIRHIYRDNIPMKHDQLSYMTIYENLIEQCPPNWYPKRKSRKTLNS